MTSRYLLTFFLLLTFLTDSATAQNLLNNPESVVYDVSENRYLVSNFGSGDIVQIAEDGTQEYFVEDGQCHLGLHIVGDILYSACKEFGVKGFDLQSGELVYFFEIGGARFLNDITADNSGNLYVSDSQSAKIYRINPVSGSYATFVDGYVQNPNGLCFDAPNNRVLLCSTRDNSPIQAISLEDSSVSTVVNSTLDILDGFTEDSDGYYYISSWGDNYVYRFENDFSSFERHSRHAADPADIFFDKHNQVLAVPIFYGNTIEFVDLPQFVDNYNEEYGQNQFILHSAYPNPFNSKATLSFSTPVSSMLSLKIYNMNGQLVETLVDHVINAGEHNVFWDAKGLSTGVYLSEIKTCAGVTNSKLVLIR